MTDRAPPFPLTRHEVDCIAVAYDELLSYWETVGYEGSLDDEEMPSEKIPETLGTLRNLLDRYAEFAVAAQAIELVKRFRQWDDLPARADGPYWMREADRLLARLSPGD